ncbi:PH domain-containing protein DDB_G0287875-like [Hydractinia symbiolongicarpus]|uniref:PH domain-containing protein DDB_G0287875-like n=1 Tax=Hydractinia symbiolongicarpus TaxID=13093 RepID=UPI002550AC09|nr:PH domain-containing protein DDB_G0287875-like [Hydractinia symbiolongicarpus]
MKKESVINGFRSTGIWPIDKTMYPKERLDPRLLAKYYTWKQSAAGLAQNQVSTSLPLPELQNQAESPLSISNTTPTTTPNVNITSSSLPGGSRDETNEMNILLKRLGPYPYTAPTGFCWIPNGWKLSPINQSTPKSTEVFEELFLDKVKGSVDQPKKRRQKLDLRGKVITQKELLEELERKAREREEREGKALLRKEERERKKQQIAIASKKGKQKITINKEDDSDTDEITSSEEEDEEEEEEEGEREESEEDVVQDESTDTLLSMEKTWKFLNSPTKECDVVGKWYACIYDTKRGPSLYIGKALTRFLYDENGVAAGLQIECLQKKLGTADNILREIKKTSEFGTAVGEDIDTFAVQNVICGPLTATFFGW